jgi:non-ribosomal peptide synthetase component F
MYTNHFANDLPRNQANHQPLTPLTFLERAAKVHPTHTAVIHGALRYTYEQLYARSRRLASALAMRYVGPGDCVSVMLANAPPMIEAHYGVPMTGAVLHSLNTRLDAAIIAFQLDHANTKILITDREFAPTIKAALAQAKVRPLVINYDDQEFPQTGEMIGFNEYEDFLRQGHADFQWRMPDDEWDAIALNYTSGTTGNPKGVVYHHRVSVDAADVPLQRLVFPVDAVGGGGHPRLPALGAGGPDVRGDGDAWCHAYVRCAYCHVGAARRETGRAPRVDEKGAVHHRRSTSPRSRAGRYGCGGVQRHACLRADRVLRPVRRQRLAERVG